MDEDTIDHFQSASLTIKAREKNTNKEGRSDVIKVATCNFIFWFLL